MTHKSGDERAGAHATGKNCARDLASLLIAVYSICINIWDGEEFIPTITFLIFLSEDLTFLSEHL
jgi:hypothetical protein